MSIVSNIIVDTSFICVYGNTVLFNLNASTNNNETDIVYTSFDPFIANVDSYGNITIGNAGNTQIQLYQPDTANYTSITANTIIYVNKALPTLSISNFTRTYHDASFSILPNIVTNNPEGPSYSYISDSPFIADIVDGIATIGNAGIANIVVTQSETTNYTDISAITMFNVNKELPTLSISDFTRTYNDPSFSILPNITTNNPELPTYSYISDSPFIADIVDGIATIGNAGITNIVATQSETTNYLAVTANTTITVNKELPTLSISDFTRTYNDPSFSILPNITTNNVEGPSYSYISDSPFIADIVDGIATIGNAGITNIVVTQSETTNYLEVTANTTITVNKELPTLSISDFTRTYNDPSFSILPNITTNNVEGPSYSYISDSPFIADIVDGTVTVGNAGITNIVATQSETTNYLAVTANTTITVNKELPTLSISDFTRTYNDPSFSILPNIVTNNPEGPSYSYISDSPFIADIVDGTVTVGNAGITNIVVTQSETTNYLEVTANTTITVNKELPTLSISDFTRTYNDPSFSILPNIVTNNPEEPTYSYISDSPLIANIVDGTVTVGNAGITNVVATQSETTNYLAVTANTTITINKELPTLSISNFTRTYNDPSFSILSNIVTNNPEGPSYSYISDSPLIANIVDGTVTVGNAGITNIVATQSETTNYLAVTANTTITVNKASSTLSISNFTRTYNDASFSILPNIVTNNPEEPTYSYISDSPFIADIVDGTVTVGNAGITNIVASQSETTNYLAVTANTTITVNKELPTLSISDFTRTYNDASFSILPNIVTNNTDSPTYTYTSDSPIIANIVDGTVTVGNAGIANVVVTQSETTNYLEVTANTTITVNKELPTLSILNYTRTYNDPSFSILSDIVTNNTDPYISRIVTYESDNLSVANIVDGIVTTGNIGNARIQLYQPETTNYTAVTANTIITVNPFMTYSTTSLQTITQLSSTNAVGYNGSYYLVGGNAVITSTDGTTWSSSVTPISNMSSINQFAWNHPDKGCPIIKPMTIACGEGNNTLAYSSDGIYWKGLGKTVFTTRANRAIWNGTLWVAVGTGQYWVATSYDGIQWLGRDINGLIEGYDIAWNGYAFVAVGYGNNASMAMSFDGVIWNPIPDSNVFFANGASAITWTGKCWLAYGSGGTNTSMVCTNTDGWRWTPTTPANLVISNMTSAINTTGYGNVTASSTQYIGLS